MLTSGKLSQGSGRFALNSIAPPDCDSPSCKQAVCIVTSPLQDERGSKPNLFKFRETAESLALLELLVPPEAPVPPDLSDLLERMVTVERL